MSGARFANSTLVNGLARPDFEISETRRNTQVGRLPLGVFVQDWFTTAA